MGPSYWWRIPGGWPACWSRGRQSSDKHGSKQAWWSAWTGQPLPGGTGCWCCCCWGRRRQSRSGSGRRPPGPPTRRPGSSVSMFSWSLSGPVGMRRDKSCTLSLTAEQESYFVIQISDRAWFDIKELFSNWGHCSFQVYANAVLPWFISFLLCHCRYVCWNCDSANSISIMTNYNTWANIRLLTNTEQQRHPWVIFVLCRLTLQLSGLIYTKINTYCCICVLACFWFPKSWWEWKHLFKDILCRVNSVAPCQKDIYWS